MICFFKLVCTCTSHEAFTEAPMTQFNGNVGWNPNHTQRYDKRIRGGVQFQHIRPYQPDQMRRQNRESSPSFLGVDAIQCNYVPSLHTHHKIKDMDWWNAKRNIMWRRTWSKNIKHFLNWRLWLTGAIGNQRSGSFSQNSHPNRHTGMRAHLITQQIITN